MQTETSLRLGRWFVSLIQAQHSGYEHVVDIGRILRN